jgi:type VI secretion system protein ImpA
MTPSLDIDWDQVLAPISKERPAGEFLIYEGTYDKIRESRRSDNALLDQGVWKTDLKTADWGDVAATCLDTLRFRSKDLQIAVWLLESWIHLYGFKGLQIGLELLLKLSQEFWEEIFPLAEDEDLECRVSPYIWLDDKLKVTLKLVPILMGEEDRFRYRYGDWEKATLHTNQIRKGDLEDEETVLTQKLILEDSRQVSQGIFPNEQQVLVGVLVHLEALEQFLDAKCGQTSPSLLKLKKVLESILRLVEKIIDFRGEQALATPAENLTEDVPMKEEPEKATKKNIKETAQGTYRGNISNREEAYQALEEAASYLEESEPHSPTPHLIRRALAWGSMSFPQLLSELVRDPQDMRVVYHFLGLNMDGETDTQQNGPNDPV